jgi:hypothetical protein
MNPRIPWELFADPLSSAEHMLGTTALVRTPTPALVRNPTPALVRTPTPALPART